VNQQIVPRSDKLRAPWRGAVSVSADVSYSPGASIVALRGSSEAERASGEEVGMATHRLGLTFIICDGPGTELPGPPICRVWMKSPLGGGDRYPEPFKDRVFLTSQEYHPDQLEAPVQGLHEELDQIVKDAKKRYAAWHATRRRGKR
jgi:hypothetical protein